MSDKEEAKRLKKEAKRKAREEATAAGGAEETEEERKKRRKLEKAAKKAAKNAGEMAATGGAAGADASTDGITPNPLLQGAKVMKYANDYSEVQFVSAIAKPYSPPGEKLTKKLLQLVNEAHKTKSLAMGIKTVRKVASKDSKGIAIMAANVAPLDVISHMPGVLEESNVPYIWVPSRYELGLACMQKRPVTCVMVKADGLTESAGQTLDKVKKVVKEMQKQVLVPN